MQNLSLKFLSSFIFTPGLILLFSSLIHAQNIPINVGDNITGNLEFAGYVQGYTFCSAADVPLYIRASSEDIIFPRIEVYHGSDLIVDGFSNIVVDLDVQDDAVTSESGEYTILVKSQDGDEQGDFFLSLQRTNNPINATPLTCNNTIMNSFDFATEAKPFTFSVTAGTFVNLNLSSTEIIFPRMALYGPSGEFINSAFSNVVAEISETLTEAGCYSLYVMSKNGDEFGSFSLSLNVTTGDCTEVCPVNEICDNQIDDDGDGLIDDQDEDCCNFSLSPILETISSADYLEVYPNPSNGEFKVNLLNNEQNIVYQLFNLNGQEIAINNKSFNQIQLSDLPKGVYLLKAKNKDFQTSKKIIVQ